MGSGGRIYRDTNSARWRPVITPHNISAVAEGSVANGGDLEVVDFGGLKYVVIYQINIAVTANFYGYVRVDSTDYIPLALLAYTTQSLNFFPHGIELLQYKQYLYIHNNSGGAVPVGANCVYEILS